MRIAYLKLITIFSLGVNCFQAYGNQKTKDFTLTIALDMSDCANCNSYLNKLAQFKDQHQIVFVMQEEFAPDSTTIIENFFLDDFNAKILWSDSLFKKCTPDRISTVTIESRYL